MKRKLIRISIALLVLIVLLLLAWRMYLASVINRELAKIRVAGLPTSGEELNRWYVTVPDNQNSALVLTQAFILLNTINPDSDERWKEVLDLKDKFPRRADQLTSEQVELIRWFVTTNQPAMAKAREALKLASSRYPIDCTGLMSTELPHLANLVSLTFLNQCRAVLAILDGQTNAPIENIEAILELAHTLDDEPPLISQLVRLRMVRMAFATLEHHANANTCTSAEILNLKDLFAHIRTTNTAARALIGERALTIPYFRMAKAEALRLHPPSEQNDTKINSPLPCHGPAILRLLGYYELDYGSYLIGMNKAITLLSNLPPENLQAFRYLSRVGEESTKRRRTLSGQTMSAYAAVPFHEAEAIAHQRIVALVLALESFRNETGLLPEQLDVLLPRYLTEVPEDPFLGMALAYRRTEQGYVVYSVGRDREDNGGLEKKDKKKSDDKNSYDITFTVDR
jgi:hypothetical protein